MDPISVVKLSYRLSYVSQNLHSSRDRDFWVSLDQGEQGIPEIGINQNVFLLVTISMQSKLAGAGELGRKAKGQIVKRPRNALQNERLIATPVQSGLATVTPGRRGPWIWRYTKP